MLTARQAVAKIAVVLPLTQFLVTFHGPHRAPLPCPPTWTPIQAYVANEFGYALRCFDDCNHG